MPNKVEESDKILNDRKECIINLARLSSIQNMMSGIEIKYSNLEKAFTSEFLKKSIEDLYNDINMRFAEKSHYEDDAKQEYSIFFGTPTKSKEEINYALEMIAELNADINRWNNQIADLEEKLKIREDTKSKLDIYESNELIKQKLANNIKNMLDKNIYCVVKGEHQAGPIFYKRPATIDEQCECKY